MQELKAVLTKKRDVHKSREKNLLKDFPSYLEGKGKLTLFRSEAIRVGFAKLWKEKNYAAIIALAERLPEESIQEDQSLLMYYDISCSHVYRWRANNDRTVKTGIKGTGARWRYLDRGVQGGLARAWLR